MADTIAVRTSLTREGQGKRRKRRRLWVLPELQGRFIAWLVMASAVLATTAVWGVLLAVWQPLGAAVVVPNGVGAEDLFREVSVRVLITTAALILFFGGVAFFAGLVISHKIAGPLHRLGRLAEEAAQGKRGARAILRKGDYVHEFAEKFNAVLDQFERRVAEDEALLEMLERVISGLERSVSKGEIAPEKLERALQRAKEIIESRKVCR